MRDARGTRYDSSSGLRGARQRARAEARRGRRPSGTSLTQLVHAIAVLDRRVLAVAGGALAILVALALVLPAACSSPAADPSQKSVPVNGADATTEAPEAPEADAPEAEGQDAFSNEPVSTPKDQWHQGEMPYLYQIDPQYANATYSNGSFAKQGCGPSALSMVYIYLTGNTDKGPLEMAQFSTENGYSTFKNGSSWTLISEGAAKLGLSSQTLAADPEQLKEALEAGHPLICVMAPGTFTQVGHYIVVERMADDGKAVVHDSNSVERSHQTWDLQLICEEAESIWSMGLAS